MTSTVGIGAVAELVVGKLLGVLVGSWLTTRLAPANSPLTCDGAAQPGTVRLGQ